MPAALLKDDAEIVMDEAAFPAFLENFTKRPLGAIHVASLQRGDAFREAHR